MCARGWLIVSRSETRCLLDRTPPIAQKIALKRSARELEDADNALYPIANLSRGGQTARPRRSRTREGFREISTIAGSRPHPPYRGGGEDRRRHYHSRYRQGKADGRRSHCRRTGRPGRRRQATTA